MEATASRKRVTDAAASNLAKQEHKPDEELPPVTTFEIEAETPNGKKYVGTFTFHVPTLGDMVDISRLRAEYLGQMENVDIAGSSIAEMLSFLHVTIETKDTNPAWWRDTNRGVNLYHMAPILALYTAAKSYEAAFAGAPTEVGDMKKSTEEKPDEDDTSDVVGDVQSPPERRTIMHIDGKGGS